MLQKIDFIRKLMHDYNSNEVVILVNKNEVDRIVQYIINDYKNDDDNIDIEYETPNMIMSIRLNYKYTELEDSNGLKYKIVGIDTMEENIVKVFPFGKAYEFE